jgi:hypothetical protein
VALRLISRYDKQLCIDDVLLNPDKRTLDRLRLQCVAKLKGLYDKPVDRLYIWCADFSSLLWYDHSHISQVYSIPYNGDDEPVVALTLEQVNKGLIIDRNWLLDFPAFKGLGVAPCATGGSINLL